MTESHSDSAPSPQAALAWKNPWLWVAVLAGLLAMVLASVVTLLLASDWGGQGQPPVAEAPAGTPTSTATPSPTPTPTPTPTSTPTPETGGGFSEMSDRELVDLIYAIWREKLPRYGDHLVAAARDADMLAILERLCGYYAADPTNDVESAVATAILVHIFGTEEAGVEGRPVGQALSDFDSVFKEASAAVGEEEAADDQFNEAVSEVAYGAAAGICPEEGAHEN